MYNKYTTTTPSLNPLWGSLWNMGGHCLFLPDAHDNMNQNVFLLQHFQLEHNSVCLLRCMVVSVCQVCSHISLTLNKAWAKADTTQADGKMSIISRVWFVLKQHTWFQCINAEKYSCQFEEWHHQFVSQLHSKMSKTDQSSWCPQTQTNVCISHLSCTIVLTNFYKSILIEVLNLKEIFPSQQEKSLWVTFHLMTLFISHFYFLADLLSTRCLAWAHCTILGYFVPNVLWSVPM